MKLSPIFLALSLVGLMAANAQAEDTAGTPKTAAVISAMGSKSTVTAINQETREVTLKDAEGMEHSFIVGEEVRNLPQVKVGDLLLIQYAEKLALKLYPAETSTVMREERTEVSRSEKGQMPYANIKNIVNATGRVAKIDLAKRLVTLEGQAGQLTFEVEKSQDLSKLAVGQMIKAEYVENLIISVERPD